MNSKMESVMIPASVRRIEKEAFRGCQLLKSVKFAEGSYLEQIDELCFAYSGVQEVKLPENLRISARNAFEGCKNLKLAHLC